jgi:branched-chain amino acid transport system permease protein
MRPNSNGHAGKVALAAAAGVAVLLLPLAVRSNYLLHILVMTQIYVVLAMSLNLVLGYAGLLSLAPPAFFGIGAYTSALLALRLGWAFWPGLLAAGAAGLVVAAAIGVPSLRLSRHSFVIVTLSFTLLAQLAATNWTDLTRGAMGLPGIPPPRLVLPGIGAYRLATKTAWFYLMLGVLLVTLCAFAALVRSRLGRAILAVREDEVLARAMGIDADRVKRIAFAASGLLGGIAGSCYAHYISFIDPSLFDFYYTENLLIMVILGGAGTIWGVVAGAAIFNVVPELLRINPELRTLLYGLVLLAAISAAPGGLAGWVRARAAARGGGAGPPGRA